MIDEYILEKSPFLNR